MWEWNTIEENIVGRLQRIRVSEKGSCERVRVKGSWEKGREWEGSLVVWGVDERGSE